LTVDQIGHCDADGAADLSAVIAGFCTRYPARDLGGRAHLLWGGTLSVTAFQDLPLADRDREWDGDAAEKRVRAWADAQDEPNQRYRDAHVWYDKDNKDSFGGHKLLIADVIDDRLTAVPRGVFAAAAVMQGSRGGIDLPDADIDRVKSHLAKYYAKMARTPPWDST
jgi:hypothetical protein